MNHDSRLKKASSLLHRESRFARCRSNPLTWPRRARFSDFSCGCSGMGEDMGDVEAWRSGTEFALTVQVRVLIPARNLPPVHAIVAVIAAGSTGGAWLDCC
jgi:hypothetical protein